MTDDSVKFSIIVAVFNAKEYIERCILSVTAQTYPQVELIVIDGGSSDGTVELLQKHTRDITYWISEPDQGIYNAWNKALKKATGTWILFLGADDELDSPNVLSKVAPHLAKAFPPYRVAYGRVHLVTRAGSSLRLLGQPWADTKDTFAQRMNIPHPGTFHHISLFEDKGCFDEQFRIAGDFDLLLRELPDHDALFMDQIISRMQVGGVSSDSRFSRTQIREQLLARRKNNVRGIPYILIRQSIGEMFFRAISTFGTHQASETVRRYYCKLRERLLPKQPH